MTKRLLLLILLITAGLGACRKEGCSDPSAVNYAKDARKDDGSCYYRYGCLDSSAINFDPTAQFSNNSCIYTGRLVFFLREKQACDTLMITVNNSVSGLISQTFSSGSVVCGQNGAYTLEVNPGSYNYVVSGDSCDWSGSAIVTSRDCTPVVVAEPEEED